jgi:hypothetical protein
VSTASSLPDTTALVAAVAGPVLVPGDPGFAEEVTGYNLAAVTVPAVVVGATSADDVAEAVRWAVVNDRKVAVQATGHGLYADLGDTVLISTRRMDTVHVHRHANRARRCRCTLARRDRRRRPAWARPIERLVVHTVAWSGTPPGAASAR